MVVWLSAQILDIYSYLVNLLKVFRNIFYDEEEEKISCDGRVSFDIVFG